MPFFRCFHVSNFSLFVYTVFYWRASRLTSINANKLFASVSNGLNHPNTQVWVFSTSTSTTLTTSRSFHAPLVHFTSSRSSAVELHRWVEFGLAFAKPCHGGRWGAAGSCFLLWLYYKPAVTHTNMHKQIQTCNRLMGLYGDQSRKSGIQSGLQHVGRR